YRQSTTNTEISTLSLHDALPILRASKKLRNDELLVTALAGTRLRMELDRVPLWRENHVAIKQLVEDFARYLYLPRLTEPSVLLRSEEHTSELQSRFDLVCRLLLE